MRVEFRKALTLFLALAGLAVGARYVLLAAIDYWLIPREATDINDYPAILKGWSASGLVNHFPPAIPSAATETRFSAFPGFLQGGAHIQLRMKLPLEEVKRIEAGLRHETRNAYAGGGKYDHYNRDQKNNLPTTSFHTAASNGNNFDFPLHYTLYVLHAKNRGGGWNHGETSGTAVSTEVSEVVYWAESW